MAIDVLSRRIWERKYIDLWTVVHLLTGACFGFAIFFYRAPYAESFVVFFFFIVLWEILEYYDQAKETLGNQAFDIISGALGFWTTNQLIPLVATTLKSQVIYFTITYVIVWALAYFGFESFALHLNRDVEKYKKSFSAAILIYLVIIAGLILLN